MHPRRIAVVVGAGSILSRTEAPAANAVLDRVHGVALQEQILDGIKERRSAPRRARPVSAILRSLGGRDVIDCPADNVSEGGLHIVAPIGFGLAVGQRFEVILRSDARGDGGRDLIGDGHYATVVRTQILLDQWDRHDRLGVAMRFDQPAMF